MSWPRALSYTEFMNGLDRYCTVSETAELSAIVGDDPYRQSALLAVARSAERWLSDPQHIGVWLLADNPQLGGGQPARMIADNDAGAEILIEHMAQWAPIQSAIPSSADISIDQLRSTLQRWDIAPLATAILAVEADLTDFDGLR
jgi:hypothetical protein